MQVHVDAVKAHIAGAYSAHDGVKVCAVIIAEAACLVNQAGDLQYVFVEYAHGVGVGEHKAGGVIAENALQGLKVNAAVGGGGDIHNLIAAHCRGGRVGAVGGVGYDYLVR